MKIVITGYAGEGKTKVVEAIRTVLPDIEIIDQWAPHSLDLLPDNTLVITNVSSDGLSIARAQ